MNSVCITIEAREPQQEVLVGLLSEAGAEGFEQTENQLLAWFNGLLFQSYQVNHLLKGYKFSVNSVEEKNWNEEWERNFEPVIIEDFCAVRADFHLPVKDTELEIVITPKMSFGTGHHATTYLMIRQMRTLELKNKRVFDFGTGTGILAILAEKLGAETVTAIDVDDWSIENARENIAKNECSRISVSLSSNLPEDPFDVVLANINRNVILQYFDQLKSILHPGAYLLVSGILAVDAEVVSDGAVKRQLSLVKQEERNGWLSQLYVNAS